MRAFADGDIDVTLVAFGGTLGKALTAAESLAAEGGGVEVVDLRVLRPLDDATILASVHKTGRLLVVDEDFAPCGIGAEIAMLVREHGFDDLDAPVRRLTGLFSPVPYSPPLEAALAPNTARIVQALRELLAE